MCPEPFYDSVMDDYDDDDDTSASSGLKRLGASLGLKLRPWEGSGVRSAKSEVSLIDFTDDSFSSTTPSPLTETRQPDEDTLKVQLERENTLICRKITENTCMLLILGRSCSDDGGEHITNKTYKQSFVFRHEPYFLARTAGCKHASRLGLDIRNRNLCFTLIPRTPHPS